MRRFFLTLMAIVICLNATSRDDVTKLVQKYEANDPAMFWHRLGTEHPEIKAMKKAIDQNKPAMQIVAQALGDMTSIRTSARSYACNNKNYVNLVNLLYKITGIRVFSKVELFVVENMEINACMFPEGTCIINTGLIENASNTEEVIAAVAHEIAHFVLWHTINDCWRTAKAIRRNQNWAEVGTVLAAGAYGASQIYSAQYGVQQSNAAQQQMYNNIYSAGIRIREEIGLRTDIFTRLRYMRETEAEADETAFWFLEKNSIDPIHLINFLKVLDEKTPSYLKQQKNNTKYSDHPDLANRIETLEVMYKKYHKPMINTNSLPALSSFKPTQSSSKEKTNVSIVSNENRKLYLDKKGWTHYDQTCYRLERDELDRTVAIESLTNEPSYCTCVPRDIKREISINLTTLTPIIASSQQKEKTTPMYARTDDRKLYFDKKGWAHYDQTCYRLERDVLDRTVAIGSLTNEPSYCNCVPGDIKREISINLSVPTGF